ncbi:MAG: redoxin domain-containing protein [Candidatus Methanoperedens sp.]|nr:redoxin domain-containing protein [Candidatus Methanoperedens sp.]
MGTGKVSEVNAQIGQKAPDFKMQGIFKGEIRDVHLEDFTGKWIVLFFSVDEILRVLNALQTGEMCPVEWRPGKSTLGKV